MVKCPQSVIQNLLKYDNLFLKIHGVLFLENSINLSL